jgi:hypothetical protein
MPAIPISRRSVLAAVALMPGVVAARPLAAQGLPRLTVSKDPTCGCCGGWIEHMRAAGFSVEVIETNGLNRVKARLGVPATLASCHTGEIAGYVIEGHVPAAEVKRLLAERPSAKGLAVPGMPVGSPGMEGGTDDAYDVVLFGATGRRVFARYVGARRV